MKRLDRPFTILLVDEDPAEARLIREAWKTCDVVRVDFHVAHDARSAIALMTGSVLGRGRKPDLILLSYTTSLTGEATLRVLKGNPEFANIPVLVLTGLTAPHTISEIYSNHANCCFPKPLSDFGVLIREIAEHWLLNAVLPLRLEQA
jgi:CheY-like chemotaxis protein